MEEYVTCCKKKKKNAELCSVACVTCNSVLAVTWHLLTVKIVDLEMEGIYLLYC